MRAHTLIILAAALALAACGGGDGDAKAGATLTIYSSLPLQGDSRPQSEDMVRGHKLALAERHNRAGQFKIRYVSLDDATAATGKWEPGRVSENARKAVRDDSTIAYLGEYNSGASAISLPILNEAGIPQVTTNTYVGLTRSESAEPGEPDKYYPTGERTYARVVPGDHIQAAAVATYMRLQGVARLYVVHDREVYGEGLAVQVAARARENGIAVAATEGIDVKAANFRSLAAKIAASGADGFFFGGITQNKAVQLFKDVHAQSPRLLMFGPDGVAETAFTERLGPAVERNVFITNPTLDPKVYPPAGRRFFATFRELFGKEPENYAIYGYEAMRLVLDAIAAAGERGGDRGAVLAQIRAVRNRSSALGTYSIDANGDTTLSDYGGNRVRAGRLVFDRVIKAKERR